MGSDHAAEATRPGGWSSVAFVERDYPAIGYLPKIMSSSSKKPLRAGVIGLNIGQVHANAYQKADDVELAALCDLDTQRLNEAAEKFGVEHKFTSFDDLLHSGTIDLVSICTPNALHAPLTIRALEAGLHVLCEKPMAMNTAEAKRMLAAAGSAGRKLAVHFNHRQQPHVQALRRMVEAGELGDLYFGRTTWHRRRGIPGRPGFVSKALAGGGAMIDLGVHQLDQLLFLMGYPKVISLTAQTYSKFGKLDVPLLEMDVDDFAVAFLRLEGGATLEMEISWASHHHIDEHRVLQLYGTDGGARRELVKYGGGPNNLTLYRRREGALTEERFATPDPVPSVQADFVRAILDDREPATSGKHGLTTMMILDALYRSSETGQEVVFDQMFADV
jgi:predicted dehydrogenase